MSEIRYKLLGKELVFTEEMDLFNSLRKKYLVASVDARKKAEEEYDANISGYSSYVSSCRKIMNGIFDEYLRMGVLDIISYGIYDIDEVVLKQAFVEECGSKYEDCVKSFVGEINRIDTEQMLADQERKDMIRQGAGIEGAYFSLSGNLGADLTSYASAQVESAAINAVAAGGTAIVTGIMRSVEKKAAEAERNTLFTTSSTKIDLLEGMERDVYMLHHTIARLINERTGVEHFYYAKEYDIEKFEPVCRNVMKGNFKSEANPDLESEQIHRILMMNPYELRMFCYIMKENGGITEELKVVMDYLCVDKASLADSYLEAKYDISDYNTYEDMVEFAKVVAEELVQFGVEECNYSCAVESKKERLYVLRRTFNQFVYDTIEERDFAEKQYYEFIGEGFNDFGLNELLAKYEETYAEELVEKNREDFQAMLVTLISIKVDEFKSTESMTSYMEYCQEKMAEHNLTSWNVTDVFQKKYKKIERKEKFDAGVAVAKEKISAAASNVMGHGKELVGKLPFGKKNNDAPKAEIECKEETKAQENVPAQDNAPAPVTASVTATAPAPATAEPAKEKKKFGFNPFEGKKNKDKSEAAPEVNVVASAPASAPTPAPAATQEPTPAPAATPEPTPVPAAATVETKICPQCGATIKATGKFCNKCGHRF